MPITEIKFYRTNEPFGCFSNFSKHPVAVDGETWPSAEHFFQASKFQTEEDRSDILHASNAADAARIGRERSRPLRSDWEVVKDDVMRRAVLLKVEQHSDVKEALLWTGSAILVEHTANDHYWADGGDGSGANMLGRILMDTRTLLFKGDHALSHSRLLLPPWEKHPELDRYSMGWRMGYGEDYIHTWGDWFLGLSELQRARYCMLFPASGEWSGYYDE